MPLMPDVRFQFLFHIVQSEQSILARTDQKAYTLLSILGVFMVFFIVYYRLLAINPFIVAVLVVYFGAAFLAIYSLMRTIQPRIHPDSSDGNDESNPADPTFFGGIRQYSTSAEYYAYP